MKRLVEQEIILRQAGREEPWEGKDLAMDESRTGRESPSQVIIGHFRCPKDFVNVGVWGNPSDRAGFFGFGPDAICYGRCSAFAPSVMPELPLNDALAYVNSGPGGIQLPFDIAESISALRREKYISSHESGARTDFANGLSRTAYYAIRPVLPVSVRKHLQRFALRDWDRRVFPRWPVDTSVESAIETAMCLNLKAQGMKEIPFIWFWPDGARACAVMTHDVETTAGRDFCSQLMDINDSFGIKSSFQVVPECRYDVSESFLENIRERGFEVNVHDFNHDGNLFKDYTEFKRRAAAINKYKKNFSSRGFRSGVLYRNSDWFNLLDFEYDMSVPNVAHLDPQHGGCCTTFPYFIGEMLEIPVTTTQDYSLFHILSDYALKIWEKQIRLILKKHGVMNFIAHPDYVLGDPEQDVYRKLLRRLSELRDSVGVWIALPGELNDWWRQRNQMNLVRKDRGWEIVGQGKEHARIAYAHLEEDTLIYSI